MKNVDLNRELGLEYDAIDLENFRTNLLNYILEIKRSIDLFDPNALNSEKSLQEFINLVDEGLKSEKYRVNYIKNIRTIENIKDSYKRNEIEFDEFILKVIDFIK